MMEQDSRFIYTMVSGDVAKILDVSVTYVHMMDDLLKPSRTASGHRRYDPRRVWSLMQKRRAA